MKNFTVIDTDTQSTRVIQSEANTVAELKRDLISNGFDVNEKIIQEGLTKMELKNDTDLLPHDVMRNGTTTNDLVFRLIRENKKVKSGALSRADVYAKVKSLNLAEVIKNKYGKNFTQCSTDVLITECNYAESKKKAAKKAANTECKCGSSMDNAFSVLISILKNKGILLNEEVKALSQAAGKEFGTPDTIYSASEIADMFADM